MRKVKMISAALIIMLSTVIFGMSGDGGNVPVVPKKEAVNVTAKDNVPVMQSENTAQSTKSGTNETVKDQIGIDTGMTKEEFEKFKKEYYNYQDKKNIYKGDRTFFNKINLLEVARLKKLNIHLNWTLDECNINNFIVRSELIVKGKYIDFSLDRDKNSKFPLTYQFKIDEIIANETEFSSIPDNIIIKELNIGTTDFNKLEVKSKNLVEKEDEYLLFLSRFDFYDFRKAIADGKAVGYVSDDCFKPYVFAPLMFSTRKIENNRILIDQEKSVFDQGNWISIEDLKKSAKEIFEINNRKDFYKRSYK